MCGFFCGIIRFGLEFSYTVPPCGSGQPDPRPEFVRTVVGKLHYLHFGVLVFILTGILTIVISLLTEPIPEDRVSNIDIVVCIHILQHLVVVVRIPTEYIC